MRVQESPSPKCNATRIRDARRPLRHQFRLLIIASFLENHLLQIRRLRGDKTTAVRILTTLSRPDGGWARVAGRDVVQEAAAVQGNIGVTAQDATVDEILTSRQNLVMTGRLSVPVDAPAPRPAIASSARGQQPSHPASAARAILSARPDGNLSDLDEQVAARLARQAILDRTGAPQLWCILDEGVLHRAIGGTKVMRSQLYRLAEVAEHPKTTIQVIRSGGAHVGLLGAFILADIEGRPPMAYLETAAHGQVTDSSFSRHVRCRAGVSSILPNGPSTCGPVICERS
jgi:Domain of unknown function (DUF5753)